jgi:tetratricopeptide (TPR) repeat protein
LPKRTRSHELESESFRKFESLVPSRWVFRRKIPDYGIDGEIEIFDDDGKSTGLFINIQLKSTDAFEIQDCLKESFQVETLKYYSSLEYPVLIAKYSSRLDKFYFTWAHAKNRTPVEKGQKTVTVHFPEKNILTMEIFLQLKDDVINYLNYRKQALRPPFKFRLFVDYSDFIKSDFLLKLRQYSAQHEVHIAVCESEEDKDAIGKIVISREYVILSIGGDSASFKLPLPDSNEILLANLNISLAILLSQIGYDMLSAKLAAPVYKTSSFFDKPDLLKGLLKTFYDAKEFEIVFEACKWAINEKKYVDEVMIFSAFLYRHYNRISREEQILVENLFLLLNQYFLEIKDVPRLASSHYNLGNFYRSKGELLKSLHYYNSARKTLPAYAERNYFWRELGGVLFDAGKITCANRAYKKSLEIEEEHDVRALYADTLIYMGQYSLAKKEFDNYLEKQTEKRDSFWCLKLNALNGLIKHFGLKDEKRDRKASDKVILESLEEIPKKETFEEALKLDPTNSFPWFQLGHIYFEEKNFEKSFWAYLWTAVCSDKNLEAWAYAFFIVFTTFPKDENSTILLGHIFTAAYERNKENFISYLFDFISNRIIIDKEKKEGLKTAIIGMVDALQKDENFELRLVDDQMVMKKFNL